MDENQLLSGRLLEPKPVSPASNLTFFWLTLIEASPFEQFLICATYSHRRAKPLPNTIIDSDLFGNTRVARTSGG